MVKVLVVDDDELQLENIKLTISHSIPEMEVDCFEQSRGKLPDLSVEYDVIITDNKMVGISGFDLAKVVRDTEANKDTPIIMLTASTINKELGLKAQDAGINKVISKSDINKTSLGGLMPTLQDLIAEKSKSGQTVT